MAEFILGYIVGSGVMAAILIGAGSVTKPVRQAVTNSRINGTVTQITGTSWTGGPEIRTSHWDEDVSDWCHVPGDRKTCPIHGRPIHGK